MQKEKLNNTKCNNNDKYFLQETLSKTRKKCDKLTK